MSIQNVQQLKSTRAKLSQLEESYADLKQHPGPNAHVDELTLRSLRGLINQLKEEITRFQTHAAAATSDK